METISVFILDIASAVVNIVSDGAKANASWFGKLYLFNHDDISEIIFLGFKDIERDKFLEKLTKLYENQIFLGNMLFAYWKKNE